MMLSKWPSTLLALLLPDLLLFQSSRPVSLSEARAADIRVCGLRVLSDHILLGAAPLTTSCRRTPGRRGASTQPSPAACAGPAGLWETCSECALCHGLENSVRAHMCAFLNTRAYVCIHHATRSVCAPFRRTCLHV